MGVCWQPVVLFAALCAVAVAKPHYQAGKPHSDAKVFRDDLVLPPSGPLGYDSLSAERGRWMAWDPNHEPEMDEDEELGSQEDLFRDDDDILDSFEEDEDDFGIPTEALPTPEPEKLAHQMPDPCSQMYCHLGRVCRVSVNGIGECMCGDEDLCKGHHKAVCGTDGQTYPSHCELHRQACVQDRHIGIDHSKKGCRNDPKEHKRVEHVVKEENGYRHRKEEFDVQEQVKVTIENLEKPKDKFKDADNENSVDYDYYAQKDVITSTTPEPTPEVFCTDLEYDHFKGILIHYHCARIGETNCLPDSPRKQFVANIMFNYYDRNSNQQLSDGELDDIEHRDHLEKLSQFCTLVDLLNFDDVNEDGNISLSEFYTAFDVPSVILDENLRTFTTQVSAGNSIELKCDIRGGSDIRWQRNGINIEEDDTSNMRTFEDGSLYINNLGLQHVGNYTCHDALNPHVIQTHVLRVQLPPDVRVSPSTQFHTSGATVMLKCHAEGVPEPEISWEMNEAPLPDDPQGEHYIRLHNNATLEIRKAVYTKDTGAYKCKARNPAGVGQDIATVFIENGQVPQYTTDEDLYEVFVVFHDKGYNVYEPMHCHIKHQVTATFNMFKILPDYGDTLPTLCETDQTCSWGEAVNVKNKFIYVSQPKLHRVVVVEIQDRSNPIEVIPTDKFPVSVQYIEHLDQVWVVCWNEEQGHEGKTIIVIRQASEDMQHHIVHTQPVGNRFDLVEKVFLPTNNDLKHKYQYGYVTHMGQQGLHKIDLNDFRYLHTVDLTPQSCIPQEVAFIPMGGQVLIHCASPAGQPDLSTHIVLDYVTDAVLSETEVNGVPYASPDGRYLVVVDEAGSTISVHHMGDDGILSKLYDVYSNMNIADVTFFPAERGRSYDFYASSANKNDVLYMNLASGKIEMIEGVGQAMIPEEWPWSKHNRVIIGGGVFGEYLMTPSRDSVVVINGRRRHVQCEWRDIVHGNVIVWVEPLHL